MPTLSTNLGDITLHSPSSQIIGTPFATNSTRFEYPFPEPGSDPSSSSGSTPHVSPTNSSIAGISGISLFSNTSPTMPGSSLSHMESGSPPSSSLSSYTALASGSGSGSASTQIIHPKLKTSLPPIPPSLIKKRPKWSLGLLGRRRSSQGSSGSVGSIGSSGGDSIDLYYLLKRLCFLLRAEHFLLIDSTHPSSIIAHGLVSVSIFGFRVQILVLALFMIFLSPLTPLFMTSKSRSCVFYLQGWLYKLIFFLDYTFRFKETVVHNDY
ncbi:hypothetical protein CPB83DRAFT_633411 [Crepidotus variabilis]|uniref:Uncharacterized protein n=1 Tax=Crepidotus variabilis TaxID=179855 RepID=A0A9P6EPR1_9AGAR|nr:hypothetical protein CPB83DRAFT_633411 [Crepidotus variabilis]